jgi:cell division protein FtsL
MKTLLVNLVKFLGKKCLTFVIVLVVLAAGHSCIYFYSEAQTAIANIQGRQKTIQEKEKELQSLQAEIATLPEEPWTEAQAALEERRSTILRAVKWYRISISNKQLQLEQMESLVGKVVNYFALREAREELERLKANFDDYLIRTQSELRDLNEKLNASMSEAQRVKQDAKDKLRKAEAELKALETILVEEETEIRFLRTFKNIVDSSVLPALYLVIGITLTPLIIKILLYYGAARLVELCRPVRLEASSSGPVPTFTPSSVSVNCSVGPDEEILVLPDFLQSSSRKAKKATQWLLNARLPFTSLASGLTMLTRIRPTGDDEMNVVVSSQREVLVEVGAVHIPEGASMVIQPRALVGVVKHKNRPVQISRKWRLFSIQAWLTLQLRLLVFKGPCTVVLKGSRGVKVEEPHKTNPRIINQASTIGFSANLGMKNTRCETFLSYLRGKEDLFNDMFEGENGVFVYEELPLGGRKGGVTGRGIEGVVDALLKVMGI